MQRFSCLEIKFQNGTHLKKMAIFDLLFTFFSHQGKKQKFLQHISHLHIYTYFAHTVDFFCPPNFAKIANLSRMVSFWCDSWCWSFFAPYWSNQWITKWWAKFSLEYLLLIFIYTNGKFAVICRPGLWMTVGEDSVQFRKREKQNKTKQTKKHCFLVAAILFFIDKNYYNLMASLSRLEALFLDVTSNVLNNCSFWNKESEI